MPVQRLELLTARRGAILRFIVGDYIQHANPVGSEHIAKSQKLGVSSATIRNEMAALEDEGYITHPHTSSGRIPSDKGYRYFVEMLMEGDSLPPAAQRRIRRDLQEADAEPEESLQLAAAMLSDLAQAMAVITVPRASFARLKHVELVSVQDTSVLLIVVLYEGRVKQQVLRFEGPMAQEELSLLGHRLSEQFIGMNTAQIKAAGATPTPLEDLVVRAVVRLMEHEDAHSNAEFQWGGLRTLLEQPEFSSSQRLRSLMEIVEDRQFVSNLLARLQSDEQLTVVIGSENSDEVLREFSIILAPYGVPGQISGALGVLGPTRLNYGRAIATVRYLSDVMSDLIVEQHG